MAPAIRRIVLTIFWLLARIVTAPSPPPPGWRPSRKRNDLRFM